MISAATVNNVVEHVYTSSTYNQIVKNILFNSVIPFDLFDEVMQELVIQLYDCNNVNLVELYNNGSFKWFFVRLANTQLKSTKSHIYYKYIKYNSEDINDQYDEFLHSSMSSPRYDEELDVKDKYNKLIKFLAASEKKSGKLKLSISIYRMYYFQQLTIKEITNTINNDRKHKTCESNIHKYLTFARNYVKENFE